MANSESERCGGCARFRWSQRVRQRAVSTGRLAQDVLNHAAIPETHMSKNEKSAPRKKVELPLAGATHAESSSSSPSPAVPAAQLLRSKASPRICRPTNFSATWPDSYGTKKLFLVARDPLILFAYWDVSPVQYQEAARAAHDGKVFLEVYVPGEGRVQQIHIWDTHKNWYLQSTAPTPPSSPSSATIVATAASKSSRARPKSAPRATRSRPTPTPASSPSRSTSLPRTLRDDRVPSPARRGIGRDARTPAAQRLRASLPGRVPRDLTARESDELLEYSATRKSAVAWSARL